MRIKISSTKLIVGWMIFLTLAVVYLHLPKAEIDENQEPSEQELEIIGVLYGDYMETTEKICKENNKPILYFFGLTTCSHCVWEKPIIENVVNLFGDKVISKIYMLDESTPTEEEMKLLERFDPSGYVPVTIIGCKYFRIGSGESIGVENETKALTQAICLATNNQPEAICSI